jgi:hypothetical protein
MEVTVRHGRCMMTQSLVVPPPFVTIPPATATSFPPDFGYLDSKHNTTALPDDGAHPDTVGAFGPTAARAHPDTVGDVGPMAAVSLQALLDKSFESIFGAASTYGNNNALFFQHLFSKGARVVDCALMEIKDKHIQHQSTLDRLAPLAIAATFERVALPIRWNVASMHAALVALLSILDDTLQCLDKAELALQKLAHHNDIIFNATQHPLNKVLAVNTASAQL